MPTANWRMYTRGTIHLHRLGIAMVAFHELSAKLCGVPLHNLLYIHKGNKLWWAWDEKEIRSLGEHVLKTCRTRNGAKTHLKKLEVFGKKTISEADQAVKKDLTKLTSGQLAKEYRRLNEVFLPAHAFLNPDIDSIDVVFEEFLLKEIQSALPIKFKNRAAEIYKLLSRPLYISYIHQQEIACIETANSGTDTQRAAKKIYNRFWWTSLGWENMKPHTEEYFRNHLRRLAANKNLSARLTEAQNQVSGFREGRERTLKKYGLGNKIRHWLTVLDSYAYLHDVRKEMQVKSIYTLHRFLPELHRRFGCDVGNLEWLWDSEIHDLLQGKKFRALETKKRSTCTCVVISKNRIRTWSGAAAEREMKKQLPVAAKKRAELKGLGVTDGKITGTAKICSGFRDALKKIRAGDVLVTGMTLPDYLPAMKKAAAIVTDEGGITCHAAIVARELKKVCVVGTRHATQVFKDGDRLAVDATTGVVKKLPK